VVLEAVLLGFVPLAAQAPGGAVTIPRVDRPPKLEDFLAADPPPGVARVTEFRQREPGDGAPASAPTTAYLSYDDANLYVVFVCRDDAARVTRPGRGGRGRDCSRSWCTTGATWITRPSTSTSAPRSRPHENLAIQPGSPPTLYRTDSPSTSVGRQLFAKVSYLVQF
jgi:hypothetical protein